MTREELLERISSRELSEWAAYEKAYGILTADPYMAITLAQLVDSVQTLTYTFGKANWEESPIPKPTPWPRPTQIFAPRPEQQEEAVGGAEELNAVFEARETAKKAPKRK